MRRLSESNYALHLIGQIAETGDLMTAGDHSQYSELVAAGVDIERELLIGHRREMMVSELGSRAAKRVVVERVSEYGEELLRLAHISIFGIVTTHIETERAIEDRSGKTVSGQYSRLNIGYTEGSLLSTATMHMRPPYDEGMEHEIRETWKVWGIRADIGTDEEGMYAIEIRPHTDIVRLQLEQLQQLRAMTRPNPS